MGVYDEFRYENVLKALFQSLIGKNMNSDTDCNEDKKQSEGPMLCNEYCAVQKRQPQSND